MTFEEALGVVGLILMGAILFWIGVIRLLSLAIGYQLASWEKIAWPIVIVIIAAIVVVVLWPKEGEAREGVTNKIRRNA